jgi:hypothetical protein
MKTKEQADKQFLKHKDNKRFQCLAHYSSGKIECAECGFWENPDALCIDHMNNGGTKHRKEIGGGGLSTYRWLIKNNFPPEYQVLCLNCNWTKEMNHRQHIKTIRDAKYQKYPIC